MSEMCEKRDDQWRRLLTHAHGQVEADSAFRASLLASLKAKTAEKAASSETSTETVVATISPEPSESEATGPADDANWSRLLTRAYVPCHTRPEFRSSLLASLKAKQEQVVAARPAAQGEDIIGKILTSSYVPVTPRPEFETRLLENLRIRQHDTRVAKVRSRRRLIFMSGLSSFAAAAVVLFVVGIMPVKEYFTPASVSQPVMLSSAADLPIMPIESTQALASIPEEKEVAAMAPAPAGLGVLATPTAYTPSAVFASATLPKTVRGIGMEINDGKGWRPMDETQLAKVEPGMSFRPAAGHDRPGLGFDDGTTVHVLADSVVDVADRGMQLHQGFMTIEVPESSDRGFLLQFPERDIAIEPGTMLIASAEAPERYADGGAPAPMVMVDNGGLALAKGKSGYGPLFANQIYEINNYVTPDLPGRPACAAECAALEARMAPIGVMLAARAENNSPRVMASATQFTTALPAPKGFEKRGAGWIADGYDGRPAIRIKYLSDEYFGFASRRRDLADALALGSNVVIDGGDGNYYEIYK